MNIQVELQRVFVRNKFYQNVQHKIEEKLPLSMQSLKTSNEIVNSIFLIEEIIFYE
jgi:hypothetical protein